MDAAFNDEALRRIGTIVPVADRKCVGHGRRLHLDFFCPEAVGVNEGQYRLSIPFERIIAGIQIGRGRHIADSPERKVGFDVAFNQSLHCDIAFGTGPVEALPDEITA